MLLLPVDYRIGFGFDVHRISKQKKELILGGITVAAPFSLEAVSDGDVVLHAISDALCTPAKLGDIGDYFPANKKHCQGLDSRKIIAFILKKIKPAYAIVNIDITIVAQKPRLASYKKKMAASLSRILNTKNLNIKIKSKEGLDILGGRDAISCIVFILFKEKKKV